MAISKNWHTNINMGECLQHCQMVNPYSPDLQKGKTYGKRLVLCAYLPNI